MYISWKSRNDIIHGKSEKSKKAGKRRQFQDQMIQLYEKGRANPTAKENVYLKMPVEQRMKKGTEIPDYGTY